MWYKIRIRKKCCSELRLRATAWGWKVPSPNFIKDDVSLNLFRTFKACVVFHLHLQGGTQQWRFVINLNRIVLSNKFHFQVPIRMSIFSSKNIASLWQSLIFTWKKYFLTPKEAHTERITELKIFFPSSRNKQLDFLIFKVQTVHPNR